MITEALSRNELPIADAAITVVDFYRDGCRFCDMLAPVLERVEFDFPFVNFVKINCSQVAGVAEEFDVNAFPTLGVFARGQKLDTLVGFVPAEQLGAWVSTHLYQES